MKPFKLIECPRDAMQGIETFIPTAQKVSYINALLRIGYDTVDFGSFVSPKAIPQMRDTAEVLSQLNIKEDSSKLLAIIANERGANQACSFDEINYLGFPFSVSETFQQRNTNKSIEDSLIEVEKVQKLVQQHNKQLVVYLSMGFGNPYGDEWNPEIVAHWAEKLKQLDVNILALSDTIGVSNPQNIEQIFSNMIQAFPTIEWGAHLHTSYETAHEKLVAAYKSGCMRFDSAIKGYGGCPMAKDELVGNMPTEKVLSFIQEMKIESDLNVLAFESAYNKALDTFPH